MVQGGGAWTVKGGHGRRSNSGGGKAGGGGREGQGYGRRSNSAHHTQGYGRRDHSAPRTPRTATFWGKATRPILELLLTFAMWLWTCPTPDGRGVGLMRDVVMHLESCMLLQHVDARTDLRRIWQRAEY